MSIMQFLASLGQIVFGGSALWIAILQWKLSKNKSKFEVYEKRYEAYKELKRFLGTVLQNAKVETQDLMSFRWKFEEHFFLFGSDIHEYVQMIYDKSLEFRGYDLQVQGFHALPAGPERNAVIEKQDVVLTWLIDQSKDSKKFFEKYLRIE